MSDLPQAHHGLCVDDIDLARAALMANGFTRVQPNAPEPLVYVDEPDDPVGQRTCPDLGSPYRTHFVEHVDTGQQIDLIEIAPHALADRPTDAPIEGDLTVHMPLPSGDEHAAALRPWFGERLITGGAEAWATVHYSPAGWERSEPFYREVLGVELDVAGDRIEVVGVGGRVRIDVDETTVPAPDGIGKRYVGANHFRFLHRDLARIDALVGRCDGARWLLPPNGGFAFVAGPSNETIELFDDEVTR